MEIFDNFKQESFKGFIKKYIYQVVSYYHGDCDRRNIYPMEYSIYFENKKDGMDWLKKQADMIFDCKKDKDRQIEFPSGIKKIVVLSKGWGLVTFYQNQELKPQLISDKIDIKTGIVINSWYTEIVKRKVLYKKED